MTSCSSVLACLAVVASVATVAHAQSYGSPPPLYPYAVQSSQPYAVEVAPNTYVIRRPAPSRAYPYVRCTTGCRSNASVRSEPSARKRMHNDRAVIEDWRRHEAAKREVIETRKVVHEKPVVVETQRVVDDPPRVIERRHYVEDAPATPAAIRPKPTAAEARATGKSVKRGEGKQRVIRAEAEVTILGPDRMSIRLFRKRAGGQDAKASAE